MVCTANAVYCVGANRQMCSADGQSSMLIATCATAELCAASTGATCATPACSPGQLRCGGSNNNTVQQCNSGQTGWSDVMACAAPQTCGGGGTAGVCGGCGGSLSGPTMAAIANFCVDTTEVTVAQYKAFVAANIPFTGQPAQCAFNSSWTVHSTPNGMCDFNSSAAANNPATCIDWCDAYAYCKWAGKRLCGKIGGGPEDYTTTTSTSDQWFVACSNGNTTTLPYGSAYIRGVCNVYNGAAVSITAVMTFPSCKGVSPNYSSIFDMSGNAAEWADSCIDQSGTYYCHSRGGSVSVMAEDPTQFNCATADAWPVDLTSTWQGFRCCAL
jgi:hypothetical protein